MQRVLRDMEKHVINLVRDVVRVHSVITPKN